MWELSALQGGDLPRTALLKSAGSFDRAVPIELTLALALALRERYGITRIAETTYLDRIGIPSTNVFVPNSDDLIGVYNGKGLTRKHAMVSGLMEALERQICARCEVERFMAPVQRIAEYLEIWGGSVRMTARSSALGEPSSSQVQKLPFQWV